MERVYAKHILVLKQTSLNVCFWKWTGWLESWTDVVGRRSGQAHGGCIPRHVSELSDAVSDYLVEKECVWLLVDNLDKGWPIRGSSEMDILIVRSLLEATRAPRA